MMGGRHVNEGRMSPAVHDGKRILPSTGSLQSGMPTPLPVPWAYQRVSEVSVIHPRYRKLVQGANAH